MWPTPVGPLVSIFCGETIDFCTQGESTSLNAAGKQIWNNGLNGNAQSSSLALDVDDNSSRDESLKFVDVKTHAAQTGNVVVDVKLGGFG